MTNLILLLIMLIIAGSTIATGGFLDIIDICRQTPQITLWGQILEDNPDFYNIFAPFDNLTLFVPSNDALKKWYHEYDSSNLHRRVLPPITDTREGSYMAGNGPTSIDEAKNGKPVDTKATGSGGNPLPAVPSPVPPPPPSRRLARGTEIIIPEPQPPGVVISTGLGTKSQILFGDIMSKQGIVQVIDTVFTFPKTITETLEKTNRTKFLESLETARLLDKFEATDQITIFVPINEALNKTLDATAIESHVVKNVALYSNSLRNGAVFETCNGKDLHVTVSNGETYINGVRIVQKDVVTFNGVVHALEGSLSWGNCGCESEPTSTISWLESAPVVSTTTTVYTSVPVVSVTSSPTVTGPVYTSTVSPTVSPTVPSANNTTPTTSPPPLFTGSASMLKAIDMRVVFSTLFSLMALVF